MIKISKEQSDSYRQLRGKALQHIRRYGARREEDYEQAMDALIALEAFIQSAHGGVINKDLERAFAQAAHGVHALPTIGDLMEHAGRRFQFNRAASLFANLEKGGLIIQEVLGTLVQPEPEQGGLAESIIGAHSYEVKTAPKTKQIITALLTDESLGIYADDLTIMTSVKQNNHVRREPYKIISVSRLNVDIAVSDQIGEVTFIAFGCRPLSFWSGHTKAQLRDTEGIIPVRYTQQDRWVETILNSIKNNPPANRKKISLPLRSPKPFLTEETVVRWLKVTQEKTGKWPSQRDREVWDRNEDGEFKLVEEETWVGINQSYVRGYRGLDTNIKSLASLKNKYGFSKEALSEEKVIRWLKATYAKNGKWPAQTSKEVWDTDKNGNFVLVEGENWGKIGDCCARGQRGLPAIGSLMDFRNKHGLNNNLTKETVVRWIKATHAKTGKWPALRDEEVWDWDKNGELILVEGEDWRKIDYCCHNGNRGLPAIGGLINLRDEHHLNNNLIKEDIIDWIKATHEKTGRWPTAEDQEVWSRDENGEFQLVEGVTWVAINRGCQAGYRGLDPQLGSLSALKNEYGFNDNLNEEIIVDWIKATRVKTGKWPTQQDQEVWTWDKNRALVLVNGEDWRTIEDSCRRGNRGLDGSLRSLYGLRQKYGLIDPPKVKLENIK